MLSNKYANYINQTLAFIKLTTYTIIAAAGIFKLCTNPESRLNWGQSINDGSPNITSYSTSILLVGTVVLFQFDWYEWSVYLLFKLL